ncbi:DinB family protein [Saliterribacillus persicus]|uniref:Putative damage-inducible protein DinB n=1 Tax=Saliterribacillus persicus TaxID=930114 RepID=A0A368X563_9BACI|nr:DinB family protein [Saliterribacillus persicus]RCW63140.1 putative damage-inducible protein DinB [Saliterribacillus persicus]
MKRIDEFYRGWSSNRCALLEVLNCVEDKHLSFKAWEGAMTLSELILHIAYATTMHVERVKTGELIKPEEIEKFRTTKEIIAIVKAETKYVKEELKSLTEEHLKQTVSFTGKEYSGIELLENGKDHEVHHKGQIFTYLRLLDVKDLPFFRQM